ncbi:hypothetical protein Acr_02g0001230 [Actinidia rufa]|uniref:Late embryogenesis abundant (LEA) hydroxyproline-rich glycoprotein family n=1 Tax=Actinidia rufa TaxID=165716 RepID=A0A7J0E5V6_9ERIC|nr:hypothetical protein Acr_02g0001230 [Actinidia rufa]
MKRNTRCLLYIVLGVILQTAIIVFFGLTFMRIRNPKARFSSVAVENLNVNSSSWSPSFTVKLNAQVTVKNTNFGHFKFGNTTLQLYLTKVPSDAHLGSDLKSGKLTLTSYATLKGKVHLFKVIKKKKSAQMNCTMDVDTTKQAIENLHCK